MLVALLFLSCFFINFIPTVKANTTKPFMMPSSGTITSFYGERWGEMHYGIDIAGDGEIPVLSVYDGTVTKSYYSSTYGNVIFISHDVNGQQYETVYAHLSNRAKEVGQTVKQGDYIGYMGNTGDSTGQHLHFEVHTPAWDYDNKDTTSVDPMTVLDEDQYVPVSYEIKAPEGLKAKFHATGENHMEWDYGFSNEIDHYNLYRWKDGVWTKLVETTKTSYTDQHLENGVTYYYYVTAAYNGKESPPSNITRQTPPDTVVEVNEPLKIQEINTDSVVLEHGFRYPPYEIYMNGNKIMETEADSFTVEVDNVQFNETYQFYVKTESGRVSNYVDVIFDDSDKNFLAELDRMLNELVEKTFTPSDEAMSNLDDAISDLKNSVGAGQAEDIGSDLDQMNDTTSLTDPITLNPTNDELPDLTGQETELSFTIPLTQDMQGNPLEVTLFTQEQMDKMTWLLTLRDVISAGIWIMFAYYIINRFTPQFKV